MLNENNMDTADIEASHSSRDPNLVEPKIFELPTESVEIVDNSAPSNIAQEIVDSGDEFEIPVYKKNDRLANRTVRTHQTKKLPVKKALEVEVSDAPKANLKTYSKKKSLPFESFGLPDDDPIVPSTSININHSSDYCDFRLNVNALNEPVLTKAWDFKSYNIGDSFMFFSEDIRFKATVDDLSKKQKLKKKSLGDDSSLLNISALTPKKKELNKVFVSTPNASNMKKPLKYFNGVKPLFPNNFNNVSKVINSSPIVIEISSDEDNSSQLDLQKFHFKEVCASDRKRRMSLRKTKSMGDILDKSQFNCVQPNNNTINVEVRSKSKDNSITKKTITASDSTKLNASQAEKTIAKNFKDRTTKTPTTRHSLRSRDTLKSADIVKEAISPIVKPKKKPNNLSLKDKSYIEEIANDLCSKTTETSREKSDIFFVEDEDVVFTISNSKKNSFLSKSQECLSNLLKIDDQALFLSKSQECLVDEDKSLAGNKRKKGRPLSNKSKEGTPKEIIPIEEKPKRGRGRPRKYPREESLTQNTSQEILTSNLKETSRNLRSSEKMEVDPCDQTDDNVKNISDLLSKNGITSEIRIIIEPFQKNTDSSVVDEPKTLNNTKKTKNIGKSLNRSQSRKLKSLSSSEKNETKESESKTAEGDIKHLNEIPSKSLEKRKSKSKSILNNSSREKRRSLRISKGLELEISKNKTITENMPPPNLTQLQHPNSIESNLEKSPEKLKQDFTQKSEAIVQKCKEPEKRPCTDNLEKSKQSSKKSETIIKKSEVLLKELKENPEKMSLEGKEKSTKIQTSESKEENTKQRKNSAKSDLEKSPEKPKQETPKKSETTMKECKEPKKSLSPKNLEKPPKKSETIIKKNEVLLKEFTENPEKMSLEGKEKSTQIQKSGLKEENTKQRKNSAKSNLEKSPEKPKQETPKKSETIMKECKAPKTSLSPKNLEKPPKKSETIIKKSEVLLKDLTENSEKMSLEGKEKSTQIQKSGPKEENTKQRRNSVKSNLEKSPEKPKQETPKKSETIMKECKEPKKCISPKKSETIIKKSEVLLKELTENHEKMYLESKEKSAQIQKSGSKEENTKQRRNSVKSNFEKSPEKPKPETPKKSETLMRECKVNLIQSPLKEMQDRLCSQNDVLLKSKIKLDLNDDQLDSKAKSSEILKTGLKEAALEEKNTKEKVLETEKMEISQETITKNIVSTKPSELMEPNSKLETSEDSLKENCDESVIKSPKKNHAKNLPKTEPNLNEANKQDVLLENGTLNGVSKLDQLDPILLNEIMETNIQQQEEKIPQSSSKPLTNGVLNYSNVMSPNKINIAYSNVRTVKISFDGNNKLKSPEGLSKKDSISPDLEAKRSFNGTLLKSPSKTSRKLNLEEISSKSESQPLRLNGFISPKKLETASVPTEMEVNPIENTLSCKTNNALENGLNSEDLTMESSCNINGDLPFETVEEITNSATESSDKTNDLLLSSPNKKQIANILEDVCEIKDSSDEQSHLEHGLDIIKSPVKQMAEVATKKTVLESSLERNKYEILIFPDDIESSNEIEKIRDAALIAPSEEIFHSPMKIVSENLPTEIFADSLLKETHVQTLPKNKSNESENDVSKNNQEGDKIEPKEIVVKGSKPLKMNETIIFEDSDEKQQSEQIKSSDKQQNLEEVTSSEDGNPSSKDDTENVPESLPTEIGVQHLENESNDANKKNEEEKTIEPKEIVVNGAKTLTTKDTMMIHQNSTNDKAILIEDDSSEKLEEQDLRENETIEIDSEEEKLSLSQRLRNKDIDSDIPLSERIKNIEIPMDSDSENDEPLVKLRNRSLLKIKKIMRLSISTEYEVKSDGHTASVKEADNNSVVSVSDNEIKDEICSNSEDEDSNVFRKKSLRSRASINYRERRKSFNSIKQFKKPVNTEDLEEKPLPKKEEIEEDPNINLDDTDFKLGDIVWSRIGCCPYWPSLITTEPESGDFNRSTNTGKYSLYHVRFFGDKGRRAWIKNNNIVHFHTKNDLKFMPEKLKEKGKHTFDIKQACIIKPNWRPKWNQGVNEAEMLKSKSFKEKDDHFKKVATKLPVILKEKKETDTMSVKSEVSDTKSLKRKYEKIKRDSIASKKEPSESSPPRKKAKEEPVDKKDDDEFFLPRLRQRRKDDEDERSDTDTESKVSELSVNQSVMSRQRALFNRNKLFKGITRDKVCQVCFQPDEVYRCKGKCYGFFHYQCAMDTSEEKYLKKKVGRRSNEEKKVVVAEGKKVEEEKVEEVKTVVEEKIDSPKEVTTPPTTESLKAPIGNCQIVTVHSHINSTPPKKVFPETFKTMSLAEQIDFKMKEIMRKFEAKPVYKGSTTDSSCDEMKHIEDNQELKKLTKDQDRSLIIQKALTKRERLRQRKNEKRRNKRRAERDLRKGIVRHVTADADILPEEPETSKSFKCGFCAANLDPLCVTCGKYTSPSGSQVRQKCSLGHCGKYYHQECLKPWPQTQWMLTQAVLNNSVVDTFVCPIHACHTCVSDDPRMAHVHRCSSDKLARCQHCPATYHQSAMCLPAGTEILTSSQIICPRHSKFQRKQQIVNANWCFLCSRGGDLICCETCPMSVHPDCMTKKINPEEVFICEDCESGRYPLYDEIVWCKLGSYRWWPGVVLYPNEVPDNVVKINHDRGEFVVKFYGTYDHHWFNKGRVFLFHEDDKGQNSANKQGIDLRFQTAIEEATVAHRIKKEFKNSKDIKRQNLSKIPPYIKIKVNKPVGNVRQFDPNLSNTTPCECDPKANQPCGPDSDCLNRLLLTECDPDVCPAGAKCCNQCFEKKEYPPLTPARTSERGWGLKSLAPIKKGQFVIEYVGEMIDEKEYQRRIKKMHECREENYYFLTIDKDRMLDAGPKGNVARFMNHSCQPNCETQKWTVNGDTRVGLFATEDIPAETELTFNYNLECVGKEKKVCMCGAPNCSGFIGVKAKSDIPPTKKIKKYKLKKHQKAEKPVIKSPCFICGRKGAVEACNNKICTKSYHLKCVKLEAWPDGNKFICPWHNCKVCTKRTIRCCVRCINSYCPQHSEGNIRHDNLLGFVCSDHDPTKCPQTFLYPPKMAKTPKIVELTDESTVTSTTSEDEWQPVRKRRVKTKIAKKDQLSEDDEPLANLIAKNAQNNDENAVTSASVSRNKRGRLSSSESDKLVKKSRISEARNSKTKDSE